MEEIINFAVNNKQLVIIGHVLFVVIGMGAAFVTDFLFVYFALNKVLSPLETKIIKVLSKVVSFALCGILFFGIFLFMSDIEKYSNSAKFFTKMSVVSILVLNGILLHTFIFKHIGDKNYLKKASTSMYRRLAFGFGAISSISWVSAMSLGVLDKISVSYGTAFSIYLGILCIGIIFSQLIFTLYEKYGVLRTK